MVELRQWQKEFLQYVKTVPKGTVVNLYGTGGEGKSFLAHYNKDTNLKFIHECEEDYDYDKFKQGIIVLVSNEKVINDNYKYYPIR